MQINLNQVCSISIIEKEEERWVSFSKKITFLGFELRKEGFYLLSSFSTFPRDILTKEDILKHFRMSNGKTYNKFFETKQGLLDYLDSPVIKSLNLIKIY